MLGTNGGGFFNANSAHPFENPTPLTNFLQMLSIFLIPAGLTYTLGQMVASQKHGWAVFAAMSRALVRGCGDMLLGGVAGKSGAGTCVSTCPQQATICRPAATWKARKYASALRTPRCLRR